MVTFLENDPNKDFKLYIKIAQLSLERTTSCRLNIQCLFLKRGGGNTIISLQGTVLPFTRQKLN